MAVIENDVIKVTVSSSGTKNIIRVSPGVAALASVSLSLNDLNNVDTSGINNGQTIVYDNGSFVAGDSGAVETINGVSPDSNGDVSLDFSVGGLSDVDVTTPSDGDILKYQTNRWVNDSLEKSDVGLDNVDNTSDANKPVSTATQTALNAKADTSAVPTNLNDLSDVSIVGTPAGNQALIYDTIAGAFKSQVSYTNRFEDEVEIGLQIPTIYAERGYSVKSEGDGTFIDPSSDTPAAGKVIQRKIYHKTGFISDSDVIGDYTLIHTFADDTAYADTVAVFDAFEDGATYGVPPFTLFQTWEEVAAAPAFTGLLNETYGSGAEAAYSTRRLNGNYSGDCMTIRRASDGTTQSIGFVGEEIDESAIETFCSGTSCTVQIWRDQSGNGSDAEQTNTNVQPTVYTGGQLLKDGGRLALYFDGGDVLTTSGTTVSVGSQRNDFAVFNLDVWPGAILGMDGVNGGGRFAQNIRPYSTGGMGTLGFKTSSTVENIEGATAINTGQQYLFSAELDGTDLNVYLDGSLDGTTTQSIQRTGNTNLAIGSDYQNNTNRPTGLIQEVITYQQNKSSDRTDIEGNISEYFQSAKLLDEQYGEGAEAAYSSGQLRRDQTVCMEIRRASDSTLTTIGFDTEGNIDEAAIETFCTGTSCTVYCWKDQSGNGNDAIAASTGEEPTIYTGGAIIKNSMGKVAIHAGSGKKFTNIATFESSLVYGFSIAEATGRRSIWSINSFSGFEDNMWGNIGSVAHVVYSRSSGVVGIVKNDGNSYLMHGSNDAGLTSNYTNGTLEATQNRTGHQSGVFELLSRNSAAMKVAETIVYLSSKSNERTAIQQNIGDYYTQNTPLLDTYSGAAAAYSLRKLRTAYTGDAVEVWNGSSYADIGFNVFGELDTVALTAHCGSNNGFVSKWYDQSSNSNDATQTALNNMPKIYDGSTGVVTENGKPAVEFDGSNDNFEFTTTSSITTKFVVQKTNDTAAILFSSTSVGSRWNWIVQQGNTNKDLSDWNGTGSFGYKNGVVVAIQNVNTRNDLYNSLADNVQNLTSWISLSAAPDTYYLGRYYNAGNEYSGKVQEIILYNTDQSGNRTDIEDNINTFYDIY